MVAFHLWGTQINAILVLAAILAVCACVFSVRTLLDVGRSNRGWGAAFASYAIAYIAVFVFLVVLALSHPMG